MTSDRYATGGAPSPDSFYDISDEEERGYSRIAHSSAGRGVKLLYCKSKVYIHPTPSAKDNVPGYIALLEQKSTWIPEHSLGDDRDKYTKIDIACGESDTPKQTFLVSTPPTVTTHRGPLGSSAFAIPLSAIYSLLIRPPSIGWWFGSIIINTRAGDNFPALFFHDSECQSTIAKRKRLAREGDPFGAGGEMWWGGEEALRWVKQYVEVERSGAEPNIYLVEPSAEDKAAFGGAPTTSQASRGSANGMRIGGAAGASGAGQNRAASPREDPVAKFVKEAGWNIMNQFSKVTQLARRTADQAQQNLLQDQRIPPHIRRVLQDPQVRTVQDEFDSARVYLARWAMGVQEQGERDRRNRIFTARDVLEMEETDVGEFELLDAEMNNLVTKELRKPVTMEEWKSFFDSRTGRLTVTVDEVKERIFHGGLDSDDGVRKEAWLFLLGVVDWDTSLSERQATMASLRDEYVRLKSSWWDKLIDLGGSTPEGEWWREQRNRIEKDVHRTDRHILIFAGEDTPHPDPNSPYADAGTNVHMEQLKDMLLTYNEYNQDLGYVQGMSDLLAPIYAVLQDDALAFWGFVHFMQRMERNFLIDQSGMRSQLLTLDHLVQFMDPKLYLHLQSADSTNFFFFFRMLLVWYKREFEWMDILHLWEVLWTDYLSSGFHLFVALAILEKHRDVIMEHLKHFDEVLKYINELSNTMELEPILIRAEALFRRFQRTVETIDRKGHFPAPKALQKPPAVHASSSTSCHSQDKGKGIVSGNEEASPYKGMGLTEDNEGPKVPNGKVISEELRDLMSRKVEVLDRSVVKRQGEGLGKLKK